MPNPDTSDWESRFTTMTVTADGPVRIVTMNRPDFRNAADAVMHRELGEIWDALAVDPGCRVVVLTRAGKAFSAGGDLPRMVFNEARRTVNSMIALPQPLIAAVNGAAVGLGASLISLCDLAIASDRAFLADPHLGVGLVPADGAALLWPLVMGAMRAKEYVFTGDRIPADTALALGLVNRVVPADELMPTTLELAHRIAEVPQQALRQTKRLMNTHLTRALAGLLDDALATERVSVNSADHKELTRALVEAAAARAAQRS
jgi:enoyl-CoA hydratase